MASSTFDPAASSSLTDYEKQRLENVMRNQAMIAALGIQNVKNEIKLDARKNCEGYKRTADKRPRGSDEPVVRRRLRSSRISWEGEVKQDVESSTPITELRETTSLVEDTRKPLSLASVCIYGSSTEKFISRLQDLDEMVPLSRLTKGKPLSLQGDPVAPSEFSLQKNDIARVVPERIMSVAFLPVTDRTVVVAGDRGGHLGFWTVECDDSEGDGVHVYQPHTAPVSGIALPALSATKVFTCSYDGTVKQLNVETSMFDLIYSWEGNDDLSAMCVDPVSPHCVYLGAGYGSLLMLDTRKKSPTSHVDLHTKRINTIDVNLQSPWLVITSSTDTTVAVWDVRNLKTARNKLYKIQHQRAVQSAQFSPSGSSIATCSYDNTIAIMKSVFKKTQSPRYIEHPNRNNRWISSFRAIWGWDDEYIYVGNMKRTIDIISTKFEVECDWLSSPLMTSIPCRLAAHPLRCGVLAGCAAGGQVFVWRQK